MQTKRKASIYANQCLIVLKRCLDYCMMAIPKQCFMCRLIIVVYKFNNFYFRKLPELLPNIFSFGSELELSSSYIYSGACSSFYTAELAFQGNLPISKLIWLLGPLHAIVECFWSSARGNCSLSLTAFCHVTSKSMDEIYHSNFAFKLRCNGVRWTTRCMKNWLDAISPFIQWAHATGMSIKQPPVLPVLWEWHSHRLFASEEENTVIFLSASTTV